MVKKMWAFWEAILDRPDRQRESLLYSKTDYKSYLWVLCWRRENCFVELVHNLCHGHSKMMSAASSGNVKDIFLPSLQVFGTWNIPGILNMPFMCQEYSWHNCSINLCQAYFGMPGICLAHFGTFSGSKRLQEYAWHFCGIFGDLPPPRAATGICQAYASLEGGVCCWVDICQAYAYVARTPQRWVWGFAAGLAYARNMPMSRTPPEGGFGGVTGGNGIFQAFLCAQPSRRLRHKYARNMPMYPISVVWGGGGCDGIFQAFLEHPFGAPRVHKYAWNMPVGGKTLRG